MITWNNIYSVDVNEIDEQHQHFFKLLAELFRAEEPGVDTKLHAHYILKELAGYAEYHFATEEKYFDLFQYEGAELHKAQHQAFKVRVGEIMAQHEAGGGDTISVIAEFMEDWLVSHISNSDKRYVACFRAHGLS
mgnify:FL=1|jgi:hemerythrin-like metal-binding protein